jgi:hypothetical protein
VTCDLRGGAPRHPGHAALDWGVTTSGEVEWSAAQKAEEIANVESTYGIRDGRRVAVLLPADFLDDFRRRERPDDERIGV